MLEPGIVSLVPQFQRTVAPEAPDLVSASLVEEAGGAEVGCGDRVTVRVSTECLGPSHRHAVLLVFGLVVIDTEICHLQY